MTSEPDQRERLLTTTCTVARILSKREDTRSRLRNRVRIPVSTLEADNAYMSHLPLHIWLPVQIYTTLRSSTFGIDVSSTRGMKQKPYATVYN